MAKARAPQQKATASSGEEAGNILLSVLSASKRRLIEAAIDFPEVTRQGLT